MKNKILTYCFGLSVLLTVLMIVGCGGNATVSGKVHFEDGTVLQKGDVMFSSETSEHSGSINEEGQYKIVDVLPGKYKVSIRGIAVETAQDPTLPGAKPPTYLINPKFERPETSGLECDVQKSMKYDIPVSL